MAEVEAEFEHGGRTWRIQRVPAREALHIMRRCGPLLPALGGVIAGVRSRLGMLVPDAAGEGVSTPPDPGQWLELLEVAGPLAEQFALLSDSALDYVINHCLSSVYAETPGGAWVKVFNMSANAFSVEVGSMADIMTLTVRVLMTFLPEVFQPSKG